MLFFIYGAQGVLIGSAELYFSILLREMNQVPLLVLSDCSEANNVNRLIFKISSLCDNALLQFTNSNSDTLPSWLPKNSAQCTSHFFSGNHHKPSVLLIYINKHIIEVIVTCWQIFTMISSETHSVTKW